MYFLYHFIVLENTVSQMSLNSVIGFVPNKYSALIIETEEANEKK